jgi:beta-lactamase regulating signal transducer with metallopeptidase domain
MGSYSLRTSLEMFYDRYLGDMPLVWPEFWQPLLWLLLGGVASLLCSRRPAHAHRLLLLAGLAAVATPLLSLGVERMNWGLLRQAAPSMLLAPSDTEVATGASEFVPARVSRPFHLTTVIAWCWLGLSVVCLARLLGSMLWGWRILARAQPMNEPSLQKALEMAAAKLGLAKTPVLRASPDVHSPVICCWSSRPVLCLPPVLPRQVSETDWVGIFCHELAHCKRRDHW